MQSPTPLGAVSGQSWAQSSTLYWLYGDSSALSCLQPRPLVKRHPEAQPTSPTHTPTQPPTKQRGEENHCSTSARKTSEEQNTSSSSAKGIGVVVVQSPESLSTKPQIRNGYGHQYVSVNRCELANAKATNKKGPYKCYMNFCLSAT